MRYGRALIAGAGSAGSLGLAALCLLMALSAFLAFDGGKPGGIEDRYGKPLRLPDLFAPVTSPRSVTPLPPLAATRTARRRREAAARRREARPRRRTAGPRRPGVTPTPPTRQDPSPLAPTPAAPAAGGEGGSSPPAEPPRETLAGGAVRDVTRTAGGQAGRVSPALGEAVTQTGENAAGVVDETTGGLPPLAPPAHP